MTQTPDAATRLANLSRLFAPKSVAVVGASTSMEKPGAQAILKLANFPGEVYPINPKGGEIHGRKVYPTLASIGKPVDLVMFAVPAAACPGVMKEAIDAGCYAGLIISGGFAESGPEGEAIQQQLVDLCDSSNFRLLGPNTAGFMNRNADLVATFAAGTDYLKAGKIAVVAQSGGITFIVAHTLSRKGYGISAAVGLGNAANVDVADTLAYLAEDPDTSAIAMYLEGVPNGRPLYDALRKVTPKKPVIVLTVGREDVGEFAQSHTGALIGAYDLKINALRQAGAVVVRSTDELVAAASVFSTERLAPKENPGVGIVTGQGGAGLVMLDWLKASGADVPAVTDETHDKIGKMLPPMTYLKNPVDTARPAANWPDVLGVLAEDPNIDAVIAWALHEPGILYPDKQLPPIRKAAGKPMVFGTAGAAEEVLASSEALRDGGMYVAETPEQLAQAGAVLAEDSRSQWKLAQPLITPPASPIKGGKGMDEHASKDLINSIGVKTPPRFACSTREEALTAFNKLNKPIVAKILTVEIAHKTEAGGVHLFIKDEAALNTALDKLDAIPLKGQRRYLIEEMAPSGVEMIIGAVRDPSWGPTIMVGLGGTTAEAMKDTSIRVGPISMATAREMIGELKASVLLDGWRGAPATDREALAKVIVALAGILDTQPDISEIEINPLRVYPDGVLALDALIA